MTNHLMIFMNDGSVEEHSDYTAAAIREGVLIVSFTNDDDTVSNFGYPLTAFRSYSSHDDA